MTGPVGNQGRDRAAVVAVIEAFLAGFTSGPQAAERADGLWRVLLPDAVITRTCGLDPVHYTVDDFLRPRVELLSSGRLQEFREWAVASRIEVFGDIAHAWCWYDKSWTEAGEHHLEHGVKSVQLIRTPAGWRISALAWDDERPGLTVPLPDASTAVLHDHLDG